MATLLFDTFTGSGSLVGHTPDTPYGGQTWAVTAGSGVNLTSGKAVPVDAFGTSIEYGAAATNYGLPGNFTLTFVVATTASFLATGDGETAFSVRLRSVAGNMTVFTVAKDYGVWTLSNGTTQTNISPANSTSYTGVLTMTNGVASCTFMGATVNDPIPGGVFASLSNLYFYLASCTPLDSVSIEGPTIGSSGLVLPKITASATNVAPPPPATAAGAITLPRLGLSSAPNGYAKTPLALPRLSAYATAHDSTGDRAADITLPSLTVTIRTGANATVSLPKLSSVATGTVTNLADANLILPSLTAAASATVAGMASAAISLPSMSGSSYAGALCSITLGGITTKATVTAGGVGGAQVTLPLFQAAAIATAQNRGSAAIVLPSMQMGATVRAALILPSLQLTVIGTAVVTATYEAYAVNLGHTPRGNEQPNDETTHYTNFPFTHVVRYKNSYYGANSTGLYLLEGTTDAGTPIPWEVKTAITDFKSPNKKTLAAAYFSGRFGPASTIKLIEGEKTPNTYSFSTPRGTLAQNHRQKFGKGTKGRYYALAASGTGTLELDGIECEVHQLTRRI